MFWERMLRPHRVSLPFVVSRGPWFSDQVVYDGYSSTVFLLANEGKAVIICEEYLEGGWWPPPRGLQQ